MYGYLNSILGIETDLLPSQRYPIRLGDLTNIYSEERILEVLQEVKEEGVQEGKELANDKKKTKQRARRRVAVVNGVSASGAQDSSVDGAD